MVRVEISDAASETGALLVDMLKRKGVFDNQSKNVVCYGTSPGRAQMANSLNGSCMSNKIKRMIAMQKAGCSLVPWFRGNEIPSGFKFPCLARRITGHGGTDIVPVFESKEVPWRIAAGWDWFSSYVNTETEYRVWVFRGEHLDTYEKVMKRPDDYKYIGRNFRNGFDFGHTHEHEDATLQAQNAIFALNLDFGAVDMLRGEDGNVYVLEVNTAPGVIKSGAQKTLSKLVECVLDWEDSGYPTW